MIKLRTIRIIISTIIFILFVYAFIAAGTASAQFVHALVLSQGSPHLVELATKGILGGSVILLLLFTLTFLFGRIYCSFLCPLGFLQDIVIDIRNRISKMKFIYLNPVSKLHYAVTAAVALAFAHVSMSLLSMLDPYANFGRIMTVLAKPVVVFVNNSAAYGLSAMGIQALRQIKMHYMSFGLTVFTAVFLILIVVFAAWKGRIYCNSICPVGGILSLISGVAIFKLEFKNNKCKNCGPCEKICKANCIDYKNRHVDFSRCVCCYNCVDNCKFDAIGYKADLIWNPHHHPRSHHNLHHHPQLELEKKAHQPEAHQNKNDARKVLKTPADSGGAVQAAGSETPSDESRRDAIKMLGAAVAGAALALMIPAKLEAKINSDLIPQKREIIPVPPGAAGVKQFTEKCIACHLCVSACPSRVISPSFLENGIEGFLQPRMDYDKAFCKYKCNTCTLVCPTGAIKSMTIEDKIRVKRSEEHTSGLQSRQYLVC